MSVIETVTVLFTDLVDSTGLLARHGPEAMDALRREHFTLLRRAIGNAGREVKNLGDGLMVVCPSAATGVDAAVAMQQAVARSRAPDGSPIGVRVGMALGDAEVDEFDYFGLPVVEAARLCAQAGAGEILATDLVRATTVGRGGHRFEPLGELRLKGLDRPVLASRVVWDLVPERRVPLNARLNAAPPAGVHGRDAEQQEITRVLAQILEGRRQVVFVSGEAGIGKTTVCGTVARTVHEHGTTVVYGRCDEGLMVPYRPWVEALSDLIGGLPQLEVTPRSRRELARLVPGLGEAEPGEGDHYLLFAAVREVLAGCAPVVVVLDDLHWADEPSVLLLRYLVVDADVGALGVLATFRDDEVTVGSPLADLLASAHREAGVERVRLRGLDAGALASLMEAAAGHGLEEAGFALRDALLAETDGNPFFVGELLRHLAETGAIVRRADGRWIAPSTLGPGSLPVSVREVIGRRVARLGPELGRCLDTAAVIGRDFELAVLASVMDRPHDEVLELVEGAVDASLVAELEPGRFSFAHAIIEHTLYGRLTATRRAGLHGRVAEAIEAIAGADLDRVGELAHHWALASGPKAEAKALDYMRAAGDRALRQLAPADAIEWFQRARDLLARPSLYDPLVMIDVLTGLGVAQRQAGATAHRATLLEATERALALGDADRAVRAALANNRGWASQAVGRDRERLNALERTLVALGEDDSPARARVLSVLGRELTYADPERAQKHAEDSLRIAQRLGDERLVLDALVGRGQAMIRPDNARARLGEAERAVEIARRLDDPFSEYLALSWQNLAAMQLGDLDRTLVSFERARYLATRVREPTMLWLDQWHWFTAHLLEGDLEAAEEDLARSLHVARATGQPDAETMDFVQRLILAVVRGDVAELADRIGPSAGPLLTSVPLVLAEAGRILEARSLYVEHRDAGFVCPYAFFWLPFMCDWAVLAGILDDPLGAASLYPRLEPHGDEVPYTGQPALHTVAQCLGGLASTLARYDDAEAWFDRAEIIARRLRAPYYLARMHLGRGAMRLRRDATPDAARADLEEARTIAERHGFGGVTRECRALLPR